MTARLGLGLGLALASTVALNWGYVAQHGEAAQLPPLSPRRPFHSLRLLFSSGRWLAGFVAGIGGWALYVAALGLAPLSLVQAVSAGGIGVLALLVSRLPGSRLPCREWLGVVVAIGGLGLLALSLVGERTGGGGGAWIPVASWMLVSGAIAGLVVRLPARALTAGAGLGVAAGVLYAAGDVGTKAAVAGGAWLVFVPALLACHGLAFVALQLGFQRGGAIATAGVATLFTNGLPIAAGLAVYHEPLPGGALGLVRAAAFVAVVGAAALLLHAGPAPAARVTEHASEGRRSPAPPGGPSAPVPDQSPVSLASARSSR